MQCNWLQPYCLLISVTGLNLQKSTIYTQETTGKPIIYRYVYRPTIYTQVQVFQCMSLTYNFRQAILNICWEYYRYKFGWPACRAMGVQCQRF